MLKTLYYGTMWIGDEQIYIAHIKQTDGKLTGAFSLDQEDYDELCSKWMKLKRIKG